MNIVTTIAAICGGLAGLLAVLGYVTKPLRQLVNDLGPLTERNSDGQSVFDEVRTQQRADGLTLKALADEFPKNGVPTRAAVDAVTLAVGAIAAKQTEISFDLTELRASQDSHMKMHLLAAPQTASHRRRAQKPPSDGES